MQKAKKDANWVISSPPHLADAPPSTLLIGCRWRKHEWFLLSGYQITHRLLCTALSFFPSNAQYLDKIDQSCWVIIVETSLTNPILLIGWFCCSGAALVRCVCHSKSLNEKELLLFLKEKLFQIWLNLIRRKGLNCESFSFTRLFWALALKMWGNRYHTLHWSGTVQNFSVRPNESLRRSGGG